MFKNVLIILFFPMLLQAQEIQHIGQLFDSLKTNPQTKGDEIAMQQALAAQSLANSKLYPTIDGFGRYDYASNPTGMLPVPPDELFAMKADPTIGQPFSENIYRVGAVISMPIFMKSIYTTATMAKMMVQSAKEKTEINLLKNEAVLVSLNANLLYIESLQQALKSKKSSLYKTKEFVEIKVNNGRASGDALLKINNAVNEVLVTQNDLDMQREEVIATIASYTGITLTQPVAMEQIGNYQSGELQSLNPLIDKLKANNLAIRAEKEKLLPSLVAQGSYSDNFAKSYNNGVNVNNHYTTVGVVLRVPIFAMDQYAQIRKSRVEMEATGNELDKTRLELTTQSTQLQNSLPLLDNSIQLYNNSIKDKQALLEIAKVGYKSEQMSMEDYLKYEDDAVLEQSRLYKSQAQKWQTLMKLAVIYGNKIEEIVK
jgi:outer membrane protein TolC